MDIIEAIVLGVVQGLTEFLPVSSSGHLVLFQHFFSISENALAFDILVHLATLLAVVLVYRENFKDFIKGLLKKDKTSISLFLYLFLASIPTAIIGLSFKESFASLFHSLEHVGIFFFATALLLLLTRRLPKREDQILDWKEAMNSVSTLSAKKAFLIGIAQSLAIAPGISRSGSTIATALFLRVNAETAAFFSFLIAIPAILGASILELPNLKIDSNQTYVLIAGFISAFVSGYIGLKALLHYVRKGSLDVFSYYLFFLSGGIFVFSVFLK